MTIRRASGWAPYGLRRARRGRHVVVFGGSQIGGSNTGQFGSLDLTLVGAPSSAIPSGVTLIVDGVTLSAYDAVHGCEPGLVEALRAAGQHDSATVLCRYVNATSSQTWIDTHLATVIADVTTAALTPSVACYVLGSQDALTVSSAAQIHRRLTLLEGAVRAAWPDCGFAVSPPVTTDTTTYPQLAAAIANAVTWARDRSGSGLRLLVDGRGVALQTDAQHPTSAGEVDFGLRYGRLVVAEGVIA